MRLASIILQLDKNQSEMPKISIQYMYNSSDKTIYTNQNKSSLSLLNLLYLSIINLHKPFFCSDQPEEFIVCSNSITSGIMMLTNIVKHNTCRGENIIIVTFLSNLYSFCHIKCNSYFSSVRL